MRMTHPLRPLSAFAIVLGSALVATSALARDFSGSNIERYTDGPWDRPTNIAVSVLTDQDVLRGNEDRTFRANTLLNRAEFVTIVMRLVNDGNQSSSAVSSSCFPDVSSTAWYAKDVCAAKAAGYIRGNAQAGVSPERWRFDPASPIQYEEALKILSEIFDIPVSGSTEGMQWYAPYVRAANDYGISLFGLSVGEEITRAEMARLAVAYQAYTEGELDELRAAEAGQSPSSSFRSSTSSSRSSSSSSRSSTSSQSSSASIDPHLDTSVRSNILVLGETSSILAGVKFFSDDEAINVDEITITLNGSAQSLSLIRVYASNGVLLGNAVRDTSSSAVFTLHLADGALQLPRRVDTSVYIRGVLKEYESGGVSGEVIEVNNVTLSGTGDWSNDAYSTTSTDTFPASETARATITSVVNTGLTNSALTAGSNQLLAQFRVSATEGDSQAQVRITDLDLRIEGSGVSLGNVHLRTDGGDDTSDCTNSSTLITCAGIPAGIGIVDLQKTIRVYGDVTVNSNVTNPSLRLAINEPGTVTIAGDVTWTDGTTTFEWLPVDTPVARGTLFN